VIRTFVVVFIRTFVTKTWFRAFLHTLEIGESRKRRKYEVFDTSVGGLYYGWRFKNSICKTLICKALIYTIHSPYII
jgi:hypothetical protein